MKAANINPDSVGHIETEEQMAEQVSVEEVARAVDALGAIVEKSGLNKSQIISHLSPYTSGGEQSWANTPKSEVKPADLGHTVEQTDYIGVKKDIAMKASSGSKLTKAEALILRDLNPLRIIAAKVAKSEALTSAEVWAIAGGVAKAVKDGYMDKADDEAEAEKAMVPPMHAMKGEDEEEEGEESEKAHAMKSVRSAPRASSEVAELRKSLEQERKDNAEFRVELAKSVALIGQLLSGQVERSAEAAPARGPKSAQRVAEAPAAQAQGFGAFGPEQVTKGGISRAIRKALEAGDPNVTETDLLSWESDLAIRPELKTYLQRAAR